MSDTSRERPDMDRVKDAFHEILEAERGERERLLEELCADDPEFRAEVEELLAVEARGSSFLSSPTIAQAGVAGRSAADEAGSDQAERSGDRIGPYKLLQQIGEGGFGVVYMAEQEEPIRRRVALKVIKPGMDTKQVIARFEAERQALAMLDHPNIAKVHDAGATPTGRPYFVMELVKGIPITDYCDEQRLGAKERLELFAQVCGAVHHAHEQGIIHRDIKPSNVMVTLHDGVAVPKVIDFGVAKATRQKLTEATLFTEYNQFIGTPEYMAPEQAAYAGLDVDRRSDVYSLGALLYELLTGTTPFEARALRRAAHLEVLRILKEEEPPKPSTRVHTLGADSEVAAKHRQVDVEGLAKLLRGDLDWIVMKAIEKDRGRRYGSAADLAEDIGRYFEQRPIEARPPSFGYRAQKLLRRRRGPFAAAAVIALLVVGDIAYVGFQRSRMAASGAGASTVGDQQTALLLATSTGPEPGPCFFDSARPSPDGTQVAAVDYCEGGIRLRDVASGTTELLTDNSFHEGIAWSPDGSHIMVAAGSTFSPRVIDVATGDWWVPDHLDRVSLTPSWWSPDGSHLTGLMRDAEGDASTVLVVLETGDIQVLAGGVRQGQGQASFSPDGRFVVFSDVGEGREDEDLFVMEVATGDRWTLTDGAENEGGALWSPDGRTIVYGNGQGMWALPVHDGRAIGSARLVRGDPVEPSAWTEHGYYFTVSNTVSRGHRIAVDPASGTATSSWDTFELPSGSDPNPQFAWAPNSEWVAVAGWGDERLRVLKDATTSSFSLGSDRLPSKIWWSSDGSEVLYTTSNRGRRDRSSSTVSALDVETGSIRSLFPGMEAISHLHVSPDQQRMLYFTRPGRPSDGPENRQLVVSDLGAANGHVIASRNDHGGLSTLYGQPLFSPDGPRVAFLRNGDGGNHDFVPFSLWVVGVDGSEERLLDEVAGMIGPPVWDPTGRMIAYEAWDLDADRFRLMVVSVEDGRKHEIAPYLELGDAGLQDWSPDGRWIGVTETIGSWELWVNRDPLEGAQ